MATSLALNDRVTVYSPTVSTTNFLADFPVFAEDDISVYVNGVLLASSAWTSTATYDADGVSTDFTVVLATAVSSGTVAISGEKDVSRAASEVISTGSSLVTMSDQQFQRHMALMQELRRDVNRAYKAPVEEQVASADVPNAADRKGKFAFWDTTTGALTASSGNITVDSGALVISSLSALSSTTFTTPPDAILTLAYNTAGDGGGALYNKVASEPSHGLKGQSADGTWYELDPRQTLTLEMAGAIGDNSTDNVTAFGAFSTFVEAKGGGRIFVRPQRTYVSSGDLELHSCTVLMEGAGYGSSVLKFTGNASLSLRNVDNSTFRGVGFTKATADTNVVAFEDSLAFTDSGSAYVHFYDCNFEGGDESVYITNVLNVRFFGCRFSNTIGTRCVFANGGNFISSTSTAAATARDNVDVIEFVNCTIGGSGSGGQDLVVLNGKADSVKFSNCALLFGDVGLRITSGGTALANGHVPDFMYFTGGGFENSDESAVIVTYGGKHISFANAYASTDSVGVTDLFRLESTFAGNFHATGCHIRAAGRDGIRALGGVLQVSNCYFDRNGDNAAGDGIHLGSGVRLATITGCIVEDSTGAVGVTSRHGVYIDTTNPVMIAALETNNLTGSAIVNNAGNVQAKQAAVYDYDVPDIEYNVQVAGALSADTYFRVARLSSGAYRLVRLGGLVSADSTTVRAYFTPAGGSRTAIATGNTTITTTETYADLFTDPVIDASSGGLLELRVVTPTGSAADLDAVIGLQRIVEA